MHVTIERLEALDALLRCGTFSATASLLHLTQPALSHRIRALEAACGTQLVVRATPVQPTPAGAALARHARRVLAQLNDAERELADLNASDPVGRVRVAASSAWGFYLLPPTLRQLRTELPEVAIELAVIGNSDQIVEAVREGDADVAVGIIGAERRRSLKLTALLSDEWYLVSSPMNGRLRNMLEVPARNLREECLIMREEGSGTRTMLESVLVAEEVTPRVMLHFTNTEAVKRAVQADLGISVIAGAAIDWEVRTGALNAHRFAGRRLTFAYYAGVSTQRYRTAATTRFMEAISAVRLPAGTDDRREAT